MRVEGDSGRKDEARPDAAESSGSSDVNSETDNPLATWLGFLVVVALLLGAWAVISQMRCNPLFSDAGLAHSRACR